VNTASYFWWIDTGRHGLVGYGGESNDGLEYRRHSYRCKPSLWAVLITGWSCFADAVVDDFGNLVQVHT